MPAFTVPSAELEDLERSGFVSEDAVADLSSKSREELEALLDEVTEAILCAQPKAQGARRGGRRSGGSKNGESASTATFTEALTSNFGTCYSFVKDFASTGSAMGSAARLRVADLLSCAVSDLVSAMRARARASAGQGRGAAEAEDEDDDLEDHDVGAGASTLTAAASADDLPADFGDALKMYSYLLSECVVRAEKLCRNDSDMSKGRPKAPKGPKGKKKKKKKKSKDDDEDGDDTLAAFCAEWRGKTSRTRPCAKALRALLSVARSPALSMVFTAGVPEEAFLTALLRPAFSAMGNEAHSRGVSGEVAGAVAVAGDGDDAKAAAAHGSSAASKGSNGSIASAAAIVASVAHRFPAAVPGAFSSSLSFLLCASLISHSLSLSLSLSLSSLSLLD